MMLSLSYYHKCIEWLQQNMLTCPSKKYLHMECPGCGLQRSLVFLFKGEFMNSFAMYPATIPMLWMIVFTCLHLKYNFAIGATIIKYSQLVVAVIILAFYIYKIINHKITS